MPTSSAPSAENTLAAARQASRETAYEDAAALFKQARAAGETLAPADALLEAGAFVHLGDAKRAEAATMAVLEGMRTSDAGGSSLADGVGRVVTQVARLLRRDGRHARVIQLTSVAAALGIKRAALSVVLAETLAQTGRHKEAATAWRAALALGSGPMAKEKAGLATALVAARGKGAEAALEDAILANPTSRPLVQAWLGLPSPLLQRERLLALQVRMPVPLHAALDICVGDGKAESVRPEVAELVAAYFRSAPLDAIGRLWDAHAQGTRIDPSDAEEVARAALPDLHLFHLLHTPRRVIRLRRIPPDDRTWLASRGIDHDALTADIAAFLAPGSAAWSEKLRTARYSGAYARQTVERSESYCGFQERTVAQGNLPFRDPMSGATCHPIDSVLAFGRTCFLYLGRHPFYVMTAGSGSKILGIYIPALQLVIDFAAGLMKFLSDRLMASLFSHLTARLARQCAGYNTALDTHAADPSRFAQPREVTVVVQATENFAHHVWNFYTGLERIVLAGLAPQVTKVLFWGSEFYGPLDRLFPEFAGRIDSSEQGGIIDPHPFDAGRIVLTVGGYFIPETLRERLVAVLRQSPPRAGAVSPDDLPMARPTIWIGLRVGDKSWADQQDGIPRLVGLLQTRFPDLRILLDGFSYPVGRDRITAQWKPAIKTLTTLAETIRKGCPEPHRVVNMVGNSLREATLWAIECDAYIAPFGTTHHKVGWFTDAPGIIYSAPRANSDPLETQLPGAWEAEGITLPRYVIGEPVAAGIRRGPDDRRTHLDNIKLVPEELAAALIELLDSCQAEANRR